MVKNGKGFVGSIVLTIGVVCLLYFIAVTAFMGYVSAFNCFWILLGALCVAFYIFRKTAEKLYQKTPRVIKVSFVLFVSLFALSFIVIESLIISRAQSKNIENADYLIILGGGMHKGKASLTSLQRVNTGIEYLKKNTNVNVVVSGGRGFRETLTEAEVMVKLLNIGGIDNSRIIMEDSSKNTYENLTHIRNIIDINKKVVIVSSEFHLFRVENTAKKTGYNNIGLMASTTPMLLLPSCYMREYFALLKGLIFNYIF